VDAYVRSRPSYPEALFTLLADEMGLEAGHTVLDIGSGTGILTAPFLERGHRVMAVEPNEAMRASAEDAFRDDPRFLSVDGTAEKTGLLRDVADFVVAGQAFHWFDPAGAATELRRVLRPGGWAVVVWNHRKTAGTPLWEDFEAFRLEWGTDYSSIARRYAEPSALATFFNEGVYHECALPNEQRLDRDGLRARMESTSYMPGPGHPDHEAMTQALDSLFEEHQDGGSVRIEYDTLAFWGHL